MQTDPIKYPSALQCLKDIIKSDGLLGLYKGTLAPFLGVGAAVSI